MKKKNVDKAIAVAAASSYSSGNGGGSAVSCCSLLRLLHIDGSLDFAPLLNSSGACKYLEELHIICTVYYSYLKSISIDPVVTEWLHRTRGASLLSLKLNLDEDELPFSFMEVLCAPDVASQLHTLKLGVIDRAHLTLLTNTIEGNKWKGLKHFPLAFKSTETGGTVTVDDLRLFLTTLHHQGIRLTHMTIQWKGIEVEHSNAMTVVLDALRGGEKTWGDVQELSFSDFALPVAIVEELMEVIENEDYLERKLRKLSLWSCRLDDEHFEVIGTALLQRKVGEVLEDVDVRQNEDLFLLEHDPLLVKLNKKRPSLKILHGYSDDM